MEKCKQCVNTTANPSIQINEEGLCNICSSYNNNFSATLLEEELKKILQYQKKEGYDCMVGVSGGKDSSTMLKNVVDLGFNPLAFSFDAGYNNLNPYLIEKIRDLTEYLKVDYEIIDVHKYISEIDRKCFQEMADIYKRVENKEITKEEFREIYLEGRKYYSTKDELIFPFVRPCQVCRKLAIRSYYEEAVARGVKIVFVGINEWANIKGGKYSAIRTLKPYADRPAVHIVHLPFLLQRKYDEVVNILETLPLKKNSIELEVETGGNCCHLAKACEKKACEMLGFHLDSARLSREVTIGFISKDIAENALKKGEREFEYTVEEVLKNSKIL